MNKYKHFPKPSSVGKKIDAIYRREHNGVERLKFGGVVGYREWSAPMFEHLPLPVKKQKELRITKKIAMLKMSGGNGLSYKDKLAYTSVTDILSSNSPYIINAGISTSMHKQNIIKLAHQIYQKYDHMEIAVIVAIIIAAGSNARASKDMVNFMCDNYVLPPYRKHTKKLVRLTNLTSIYNIYYSKLQLAINLVTSVLHQMNLNNGIGTLILKMKSEKKYYESITNMYRMKIKVTVELLHYVKYMKLDCNNARSKRASYKRIICNIMDVSRTIPYNTYYHFYPKKEVAK